MNQLKSQNNLDKLNSIVAVLAVNGHYYTIAIMLDQVDNKKYTVYVINSANYRWIKSKKYWGTGFYEDMFSLQQDIEGLEYVVEEIVLQIKNTNSKPEDKATTLQIPQIPKSNDGKLSLIQQITKNIIEFVTGHSDM